MKRSLLVLCIAVFATGLGWGAEPEYDGKLARMESAARPAAAALRKALRDNDEYVQLAAARALGGIGPEAKDAIPDLVQLLKGHGIARPDAAWALARMGPEAHAAIPTITELLQDKGPLGIRRAAASALGDFGPAAKEAVPALTASLQDANEEVRKAAAEALEKIRKERK